MPDIALSVYQAIFTFAVAAIALLASPGPATLALAASLLARHQRARHERAVQGPARRTAHPAVAKEIT